MRLVHQQEGKVGGDHCQVLHCGDRMSSQVSQHAWGEGVWHHKVSERLLPVGALARLI